MRRGSDLCLSQNAWIGLLDHLLAKIYPYQVVLIKVVVEHVFSGFA